MDEVTTLLKARDLAERAGLPEADVKRFLRTYGEFFVSRKQGRTRLYSPETADLLKQIAELEAMGTTVSTIKGILKGGQDGSGGQADPATVVPGGFPASMGETLTLGALSDIKNLQETVRSLQEQVASLRETVTGHEQRLIGHQQLIRLLRHDFDEQKTEILARRVEERSTPFWRRLFPGKDVPRR
jgi:DNA-binding transcriptional MerR regulator